MRKNIKIALGIIVILAFAFCYAHIAKTQRIYDKNIDPSEYGNVVESNQVSLEQTFVSKEDTLDGIRIKGAENNDISKVYIQYSLREADTGKEVAKGKINAKEALKSRFYELPFDTISGCKGKTYVVTLEQYSEDGESTVNFSFEKKVEKDTELLMDDEHVEGTLIIKTVTDRFDLETFFVVLLFLVYIIFFVRLLYKLFK